VHLKHGYCMLIHFIHGYYCIYRPWQPLTYLYYDTHVSLCTNLLVSRIWGRFLFTVWLSESGDSHSDLGGFGRTFVGLFGRTFVGQFGRTFVGVKSDKTFCPTWVFDRWYTWRDLYLVSTTPTKLLIGFLWNFTQWGHSQF
jgi:hypothetical protein